MRPLNKIEKYLKRFTSEVEESERSRYFKLNGCVIRVSDHFAIGSVCYISILLPTNDNKCYVITNHKTAKIAVVNYDELKGIVKSLAIIPDIIQNAETNPNQSVQSRLNSLETKNSNLKETVDGLQKALKKQKAETNQIGQKWSILSGQYAGLQDKYKNLQTEYNKIRIANKNAPSKSHTIFGLNELNIPLTIRQQIKELIQPYK